MKNSITIHYSDAHSRVKSIKLTGDPAKRNLSIVRAPGWVVIRRDGRTTFIPNERVLRIEQRGEIEEVPD